MEIRSTSDIRRLLQETLAGVRSGQVSATAARTRVLIARAYIDTLKIEIVTAQLGSAPLRAVEFPHHQILNVAAE